MDNKDVTLGNYIDRINKRWEAIERRLDNLERQVGSTKSRLDPYPDPYEPRPRDSGFYKRFK